MQLHFLRSENKIWFIINTQNDLNEYYKSNNIFLNIFRYFESGVCQGFFQRYFENIFRTPLPDVKYLDIVFNAANKLTDEYTQPFSVVPYRLYFSMQSK